MKMIGKVKAIGTGFPAAVRSYVVSPGPARRARRRLNFLAAVRTENPTLAKYAPRGMRTPWMSPIRICSDL
jgi:hypothetical protein